MSGAPWDDLAPFAVRVNGNLKRTEIWLQNNIIPNATETAEKSHTNIMTDVQSVSPSVLVSLIREGGSVRCHKPPSCCLCLTCTHASSLSFGKYDSCFIQLKVRVAFNHLEPN
jgi:hypothetical protein